MKIRRLNFDDIKLSRNPLMSLERSDSESTSKFALETLPKFQKINEELQNISSTLENYARAENIRIKFKYDPTSADETAHKLNISITDNGLLHHYISKEGSLAPEPDAITVFQPDKNHSREETFAQRVFRTVSDLAGQLEQAREKAQNSLVCAMLETKY